jgi:acyl carrier protein
MSSSVGGCKDAVRKGRRALPKRDLTEGDIRDWCIAYVGRMVGDRSIPVGPEISFARMGLDSASSAYFIVELEDWLGVELAPEIVAEHPTIAELARHVAGLLAKGDGAAG